MRQKERELDLLLQDFEIEPAHERTRKHPGIVITEKQEEDSPRWVRRDQNEGKGKRIEQIDARAEEPFGQDITETAKTEMKQGKGKEVIVEQLPPRPVRKRQWLPKTQGQTSAAPTEPMVMMVGSTDPKGEYWSDEEYWSDNEPTTEICFDGVASVVMPIERVNPKPKDFIPPNAEPLIITPPVPAMSDHVKPLHMKGWVNGKPFSRMLIDGGAAVNVMPVKTLYKLGRKKEELIPTKSTVTSFMGDPSKPLGCLLADITIGSITKPTMFFVMNTEAAYSVLLSRDWLHSARCLPSTFHQKAWFWKEDGEVEEVEGDHPPFPVNAVGVEASALYNGGIRPFLAVAGSRLPYLIGCDWTSNGYELLFSADPTAHETSTSS